MSKPLVTSKAAVALPPLAAREDYDYINIESQRILAKGYIDPKSTKPVKEAAIDRVNYLIDRAEDILGRKLPTMRKGVRRGWISPSSPVWSNFGTDRGLPISCNGSYMEDTVDSIVYKVAEIGMMTKEGAGTSVYMGAIRPAGTPISGGGKALGPVHFARLVQEQVSVISQSNVRRGNAAPYIDIDHGDIDEWLRMRSIVDGVKHEIQHLSFGIVITDRWMEEMLSEAKGGPKRKLLVKIINKRLATGYPYIVFKDNANRVRHDRLKELGLEILASNLCIAGDQRVVTSQGLLTAKELHERGGDLTLFDGEKVVTASPMKLRSASAEVFKVTLANGMEHKITDHHMMPVRINGSKNYALVPCDELKVGDRIEVQTQKGLFGPRNMVDEAFMLGVYHGDGTDDHEVAIIDLWENKFDLEPEIIDAMDRLYAKYPVVNDNGRVYATPRFSDCQVRENSEAKRRLSSTMLRRKLGFAKGVIPQWLWEADEATVWAYLRGVLVTDGSATVTRGVGSPVSIAIASIRLDWLRDLQLLMRNLGLSASIYKMRDGQKRALPDGRGGVKDYNCKPVWRIVIGNKTDALEVEKNTGFLTRKGLKLVDRDYRDNSRKVSEIVSIEKVGEEPVYCPSVNSAERLFIAQGVRTSNCTEIMLPSGPDESFVCNLSSLNLLYFQEWKHTDLVAELVYFLDAVMSEYIEKCRQEGRRLLADALRFAERWRAIGIGTLGYHSYLQWNLIPFRSQEARDFNIEAHKLLAEKALAASRRMATEYGEPEGMKGTGQRHLTLCAIAPTRSSSLILGQVSKGIEPWEATIFEDDNAKTTFVVKNKAFEALMKVKGIDIEPVWNMILANGGSVQNLPGHILDDHEKAVFESFLEIGNDEIIHQNNDRTPFVDQGISLNLKNDPSDKLADHVRYIVDAWRGGSKSLYYMEVLSEAQRALLAQSQCAACEA